MKVITYKTKKVVGGDNLYDIFEKSLPKLENEDIVVVTSKIVSICQGRIIKKDNKITKEDLIEKEADLLMPEKYVRFGVRLTIKDNLLIGSAGIDESNGNGYFVLWPKDLQKTTNQIWKYLKKRHKLKYLGIILTDSHSSLLRRGSLGLGISWCGFKPLKTYVGKPDIFGRKLSYAKANVVDALAASAVINMGEGNEQTPLAVISDASQVEFVDRIPSKNEIKEAIVSIDDDVYLGAMSKTKWIKKRT